METGLNTMFSKASKHRKNLRDGIDYILRLPREALHGRFAALGNARWTLELLVNTWHQGRYGRPREDLEYKTGASGGGLDVIDFRMPNGGSAVPRGSDRPLHEPQTAGRRGRK